MNQKQAKIDCLLEINAGLLQCVYEATKAGELMKALEYQKRLDENITVLLSLELAQQFDE
ncbi:SS18_family [Hexamita inflata]|uniref:SS18 family n=1 Tax=Hexamita inflata TaxID=28002 RepID=A0AA86RET8_9EUKA|nr:SS18 family [Hexamita inflata]CAI9969812.1 SS18 family [Hexamita inflata]CAI9971928.1 SS18 family [Hexamita inflata]